MDSGNQKPAAGDLYRPAEKRELDPHFVHERLMAAAPRTLQFTTDVDMGVWRKELSAALRTCLGDAPPVVLLEPSWSEPEERNGMVMRRVEFTVEPHQRALGWMITPDNSRKKRPTILCLQGHTSGAHISFSEPRYPQDPEWIAGERDYATQAVARGYNAFVLEQRAFGERMDSRPREHRRRYDYADPFTDQRCRHQAMVALLLGRTLVGERVHDVQRAVDLLWTLPEVDQDRLGCAGNSGGGTVAYYAACLDHRIGAVMPSCSFCRYVESIGQLDHCTDNYLPGALKYFDMPDLAGLIAPRPMVVVAGIDDPIFPYQAVVQGYEVARRIYERADSPEALRFVTGDGGHRFFSHAWDDFAKVTGWLSRG